MERHPAETDPDAAAEWLKRYRPWTPHNYGRVQLTQNWPGKNHGKPLCRASVHNEGRSSVGFHQCTMAGVVQTADPERLWWCRIHNPTATAEREAKREAKYRAEQEKWRAKYQADQRRALALTAIPSLVAALEQIEAGHNDPRSLAAEVLSALPEALRG